MRILDGNHRKASANIHFLGNVPVNFTSSQMLFPLQENDVLESVFYTEIVLALKSSILDGQYSES